MYDFTITATLDIGTVFDGKERLEFRGTESQLD